MTESQELPTLYTLFCLFVRSFSDNEKRVKIDTCMKLPAGVLSRVVVSRRNGSKEVGRVAVGSFRFDFSKKFMRAA